jgi:hypothetical protein
VGQDLQHAHPTLIVLSGAMVDTFTKGSFLKAERSSGRAVTCVSPSIYRTTDLR